MLQKYFDELKPAKKRESEWKAFEELQAEYPAQDIADCFTFVQEHGIGGVDNPQPCHSPIAFLSKAIGEVMPKVETRRRTAHERIERERLESEAQRKRADEEADASAEWERKERAFIKTFPCEERQKEVLAEMVRNLPFRAHSQAGRIMAIGRWWDGLNQTERLELGHGH